MSPAPSSAAHLQRIVPRDRRTRPLLLLIDGYSLVFRSYFALAAMGREMHAPDGLSTNALYSFTTMLLNALEQFNPNHLLIAIDAHGPTFREDLYPAYKGHREEAPEDLRAQLDILREYLTGTGMPWREVDRYEADDIVGTCALRGVAAGCDVAIITGDKDLFQLVSDNVTVYITKVGTSDMTAYDSAAVSERFGVSPAHFVDYKALLGDPSDNIPGVPGIGDKTAQKLLAQFPTVEELLAHAEEVEPKGARAKLTEFADQALLSKQLSRIATDTPLAWEVQTDPEFTVDFAPFAPWFARFGFRSFLKRYELDGSAKPAQLTSDAPVAATKELPAGIAVTIVQSLNEVDALVATIRKQKHFALDFETTGLNARIADMVGIALAVDAITGYYIPVGHHAAEGDLLSAKAIEAHQNLPLKDVLERLGPLLEDPQIATTVQNGKYEYAVCKHYGLILRGIAFDTFVASYLLDPDQRHGLKDLAQTHLNLQWGRIEDLIGTGKKQISMAEVPIGEAATYAAHDAVATYRLQQIFAPRIQAEGFTDLFTNVEVPLVPVLAEMETEGIRVDAKVLEKLGVLLNQRLAVIETDAVEATGGKSLNLNSPKQLSEFLFIDLALPNPKKGSTDIEVLEELVGAHPLIPLIIESRELSKLRGTYIQGLLPLIEDDGRIHTSYNQGIAATGRLSSNNPNLQNIPIRTDLGRQIRKAFIPRNQDYVLISGDYSQIELRLLAHYSQDENLLEVFRSGGDIHTQTAVDVLGMDPKHPDAEKRRHAKVINFGIIYGMGAFSLAKTLNIPQSEAKSYIEGYFARFPRVQEFFEHLKEEGRRDGFVTTYLGRRRFFPDLKSSNGMKRSFAERAAMNMPLQGGASDLIKQAMVAIAPQLAAFETYMLLQVHDELVFEAPKSQVEAVTARIGEVMANAHRFLVPIEVDLAVGTSWYDLKDVAKVRSKA